MSGGAAKFAVRIPMAHGGVPFKEGRLAARLMA
jgi:hypothetical protein